MGQRGITLKKVSQLTIEFSWQFPDDHDVLKFSTSSLRAPEMAQAPDAVNEAESKKFEQEFEEYQKKLKEQKDKWAEENPDQVKPDTDEWDSWFSEQDKELQQIFQGQSEMKNHLLELTRKMDDIIRRQERTMSMIGVINEFHNFILLLFSKWYVWKYREAKLHRPQEVEEVP